MPLKMMPIIATAALLMVSAGCRAATDAPQTITARQQNFKSLGKAFKELRDELGKSSPDKGVIVADAQSMEKLAQALPGWFPAGTGLEAGVKTAAKAEIWTQPAAFKTVSDGFAAQTHKLVELALAGDPAAIGAQIKETGAACGACHKEFRTKDE